MPRRLPFAPLLVLATAVATPRGAGGQEPTPEECAAAVGALSAGVRDPVRWQVLPECGRLGADALAAALADAGSESGTNDLYLRSLTSDARSVQAGSVLEAAETLARDRSATRAARVAGLLVLLGQHDPALHPPLFHSWEELVGTPLAACRLSPLADTRYVARHPMPEAHVDRIRGAVRDLAIDEDPAVRALAGCMERHLGSLEP